MDKRRRTSGSSQVGGARVPATPEARGKEVAIKCQGAATRTLKELEGFQGALKTLSDANAAKLTKEILELGFSEPISIWQQDGHCYILNGHQRVAVLKILRDLNGYRIPPLPVSIIKAKSFDEAKRKVLALTSQYGEMTEEGLIDFMAENDITLEEIEISFRFPEIDMTSLYKELEPQVVADVMPDVDAEPITERNELILLGQHRLLCGDATQQQCIEHLMEGKRAGLVATDPPWGLGWEYEGDFPDDPLAHKQLIEKFLACLPQVTSPGALVFGVCLASNEKG